KRLALVRVGDMHFDDRHLNRLERVVQRDGSVRVSARVEHDGRRGAARLLHPIDELAFVIALPEIDGESERLGTLLRLRLDIGQGRVPVDFRLAGAQKVQIRTVQDEDGLSHKAVRGAVHVAVRRALIASWARPRKRLNSQWLAKGERAISLTGRMKLGSRNRLKTCA